MGLLTERYAKKIAGLLGCYDRVRLNFYARRAHNLAAKGLNKGAKRRARMDTFLPLSPALPLNSRLDPVTLVRHLLPMGRVASITEFPNGVV
jgi:hypothetical protein